MSIEKLPSGRLRVMVRDPRTGKRVNAAVVLGLTEKTFAKGERKRAAAVQVDAERKLHGGGSTLTVKEFAERWTTDPIYERPKESTNIHYRERIKGFVREYGHLALAAVDDMVVARWVSGGRNRGSIPTLRAMFGDATSPKAGRLIERNPFANLGLPRGKGLRDQRPPGEAEVWNLIECAKRVSSPSFAAWLQVACFTGMRPGELDALRWESVLFARNRVVVKEQFNAKTRAFAPPKNGLVREAPLPPQASEAFADLPRSSEFCFTGLHGQHWTPSARAYHWKAVRAAAGFSGSLYLATRHFAGWYMTNVLLLPSEDVAVALGHTDGGHLVRVLYGHRDHDLTLDRVNAAYATAGRVISLSTRSAREGA